MELESTADGASTWVHVDVREFHKHKDNSFFIREEKELMPQSLILFTKNLVLNIICTCNITNDTKQKENIRDSSILYTLNDATEALKNYI